jgi:hypothetical protein
MKKVFVLVLVLALVLGIVALRFLGNGGPPAESKIISPESAISNALATASPRANAAIDSAFSASSAASNTAPRSATATKILPAPAGPAFAPEVTNMEPFTVLENARTAIRNYHQRFDGNPVGNNEEITRALMGENPKQVNFITADTGLRVNGKGELLDAWGTPFFFHQLSGSETEIRSAGPDKIFYTLDDLLTR